MRIVELHLEVKDVRRSYELYKNIFPPHKLVSWNDGKAIALVFEDGAALGLWQEGALGNFDGRAGTHVHYAFQIKPEEYNKYQAKLEEAGLEIQEHAWPNGHRSIYFFDYDGHQGEFMTCDWLGLKQRTSDQ